MKGSPVIVHRVGAFLAAGLAAWPVMAHFVASAAAVGGCVRAHGVVGFLVTHGAMMRSTPACPSSAVGLPAEMEAAMMLALSAAVLMAAVHTLIAAAGSHLAQWVHQVAQVLTRVIAPVLKTTSNPSNFRLLPVGATAGLGQSLSVRVPWRRGPPQWRYAAL